MITFNRREKSTPEKPANSRQNEEFVHEEVESEETTKTRIIKKMKKKKKVKQTKSNETRPEGVDFIAPAMVKELLPQDNTIHGKANDYLVEIGGTNEPVRYYRSFFAEITGGNTWSGMLDPLILGDFGKGDTDLAIHIEPVETTQELEEINKRIIAIESDLQTERNQAKIYNLKDELYDLKDRQKRLRTNVEKPYRVSLQAVVSSPDLDTLKKYSNNLVRKFAGKEIIMRSPDGKQLDALFNITPLSNNFMYKEHTFSYETSNLADFFPFGHGGITHRSGIIWGFDDLGRPVYYDGWHPSLMNHNMVIFGRSGGGKTYASMTLTHRSAHLGIKTAILDPKGDYREFCRGLGCPYIDLSPESPFKINFFDVDVEERIDGQRTVNIDETVSAARAIVFKMLRIMDSSVLTGKVKVRIENKIREMYKERGITRDPESLVDKNKRVVEEGNKRSFNLKGRMKEMPTLGDLYKKMDEDNDTKDAAELLKNFTRYGDSPTQSIFDTQSTVNLKDAPIFAFALDGLDEEVMRPIGMTISTKWVTTKFAKKNRHQKKRFVIDEAQIPMEDEETAIWLENQFRIARFFNTSMCAVTQGFEVFTRLPQGMGILKNAPTKLFLRQEPIDIQEVQGKFDLSDGEAHFLVHQAAEGLGELRIDAEASIIKIDSTPFEFKLFNTKPTALAT